MKFVKKLTALFLAIVMTMAMGITAFADGSYTITIDNETDGYTYVAYQVFAASVDSDGKLGDITWGENIDSAKFLAALQGDDTFGTGDANLFKNCETAADVAAVVAGDSFKQTTTTGADGVQTTTDSNLLVKFADLAGKNLNSKAGKSATYNENDKNYTISGVDGGYWIVKNTAVPEGSDDSLSRYLIQVVKNTTIKPKTEKPSITKTITDTDANAPLDGSESKVDTAAIGDVIDYQVAGEVPDYTGYNYYYYILNDTLSKGLTLTNANGYALGETDPALKRAVTYSDIFTVTIGTGVNAETLDYAEEKDADAQVYYVVSNTDSDSKETKFTLSIENIEEYTIGDAINIVYHAKVNAEAEIGLTANTNEATLQYSNNPNTSERHDKEPGGDTPPGTPESNEKHPTGETPKETTKTYVTELELSKIDADEETYINALAGAEFTLYGEHLTQIKFTTGTSYVLATDGTATHYLLKDGTYTTVDPITSDSTDPITGVVTKKNVDDYASTTKQYKVVAVATAVSKKINETDAAGIDAVTATIDSEGKIKFTGLNAGTYTLKETHTPDGYNTAADITFTIDASISDADQTKGQFQWSTTSDTVTLGNGKFAVTVENKLGSTLPSTGGMGTAVIYIAGIVMIVAAGIVVIARKRMA